MRRRRIPASTLPSAPVQRSLHPVYRLYALFTIGLHVISQIYISTLSYIMTLRLGKLWGAAGGVGTSKDVDKVEEVKIEKVRRRRRKDDTASHIEAKHFPGMVNLSGTLCYMNSVLQAFASIASLVNHLEKIIALAVEVDLPTPVTDALFDVLQDLNTPHNRPPPALRPSVLLHALAPLPQIRRLLATREQQDAHELFVVLAEAVSDEALKVAGELARLKGLGDVLSLQGYVSGKITGDPAAVKRRSKIRGVTQPWEGLTARRRVCKRCGHCEALRMDTLSGMELAIPLHGDTTIEACIGQYLAPENLEGVTCEMCSLRQTLVHYSTEVERLSSPAGTIVPPSTGPGSFSALENLPTSPPGIMTASRKKRARDAKRVESRLKEMVDSNTVSNFGEATLPSKSAPIPIKWQTVHSDSIREAIISRPPRSLRLHLIRSEYTPYGAVLKKTARVAFPVILDLSRYVADGIFEERANVRSLIAQQIVPSSARVLYRLESVILHYGYTHSSGHFVCIRRKPSISTTDGVFRPGVGQKSCPDGCSCQDCLYFGPVRDPAAVPGRGWLRISDDEVEEVGLEALVDSRSAVFMCFYERVENVDISSETTG